MKQFQYTIKDELGVHARPAGLLVKLAKQYTSTITIEKNGKICDMRKLMAVMGMGIRQGETITLDDIHMLSPGDGFKWDQKEQVIGKVAKKEIKANEIIYKDNIA